MEQVMALLGAIDWINIGTLAVIVLLASIIANIFEFRSRFPNVLLTVFIFVGLYIGWTYFLKGMVFAHVTAGAA